MSESPNPPHDIASWMVHTVRARRGVLTVLALLAGLGLVTRVAWQAFKPMVARGAQYQVTPQSVAVTPAPPWVRDDVVADAFRTGGLAGDLSVLDPPERLEQRLAEAVVAQPWVRRIGGVTKSTPNRVSLEVEYRRPLAAVDLGGALLPVDVDGAVLPSRDLSADALRYLPRIDLQGVAARPPEAGAVWAEPRLAGAVALVAAFGDEWRKYDLFQVRVDRTPDVRAGTRFWNYSLISTGNTVVVWGAAPGFAPPDEASFAKKHESLRRAISRHGRLDSVSKSPALIDVRDGGVAYPRVVMKSKNRLAAKEDDETEVK